MLELALKRPAIDAEKPRGVCNAALGPRELLERDAELDLRHR